MNVKFFILNFTAFIACTTPVLAHTSPTSKSGVGSGRTLEIRDSGVGSGRSETPAGGVGSG